MSLKYALLHFVKHYYLLCVLSFPMYHLASHSHHYASIQQPAHIIIVETHMRQYCLLRYFTILVTQILIEAC